MAIISDPSKFLRAIESFKGCPPAILIQAADLVRPRRFSNAIIQRLNLERDVKKIDGRSLTTLEAIRALTTEINSRSLLASDRFIVVTNFQAVSAELQRRFIKQVSAPPDFVRLHLLVSQLTAAMPIVKWIDEFGARVKFEELKGAQLMRWIEREMKYQGISEWEEQAVSNLAQDSDLDSLAGVIQNLALYLDGAPLTKKVLREFVTLDDTASDFELLDLLTSGAPIKAQVLLAQLMRDGKNEFALLAFLQRSFTMLLRMKQYLESGVDSQVIKEAMSLSPWLFSKYLGQVKRYTKPQLKRAMEAILCAEGKLKNRSLGAEMVLDEAMVFLKAGNG